MRLDGVRRQRSPWLHVLVAVLLAGLARGSLPPSPSDESRSKILVDEMVEVCGECPPLAKLVEGMTGFEIYEKVDLLQREGKYRPAIQFMCGGFCSGKISDAGSLSNLGVLLREMKLDRLAERCYKLAVCPRRPPRTRRVHWFPDPRARAGAARARQRRAPLPPCKRHALAPRLSGGPPGLFCTRSFGEKRKPCGACRASRESRAESHSRADACRARCTQRRRSWRRALQTHTTTSATAWSAAATSLLRTSAGADEARLQQPAPRGPWTPSSRALLTDRAPC
jgi:hypothetical protein